MNDFEDDDPNNDYVAMYCQDERADAFSKLICNMLRGSHYRGMSSNEVSKYTTQVGVAIHNIPYFLAENKSLNMSIIKGIDDLDPSSSPTKWGMWVSVLVPYLIDELPSKTPRAEGGTQ